ncbi:MAG TPA: hypothetical protein VD788_06285, partial [Candidatus Polarisedimenticolaceae bacterium]|nr:hypothetical protein [Candidatus Polarisedimenticolaceae bacterium]
MSELRRFSCVLSGLLLVAGSAFAGTDELRVSVTATGAPGGAVVATDSDGAPDDGVATKGVIAVDFLVPGTAFAAGQAIGSLTV